jgi:hypothetical protein
VIEVAVDVKGSLAMRFIMVVDVNGTVLGGPVVTESLNNVTPPATIENEAKPVAVGGSEPLTESV